jgi:hypothetical protein
VPISAHRNALTIFQARLEVPKGHRGLMVGVQLVGGALSTPSRAKRRSIVRPLE